VRLTGQPRSRFATAIAPAGDDDPAVVRP